MAVLAARLRGLENSRTFSRLRNMVQPAASFANAILARLTAREPVHPRWHGQLHLERQAKAGRQPSQPIFRRLVERLSPKGERQRALRTLSLPDSLLDALELDLNLPGIESASSDFLDAKPEAALEFGEINPAQPFEPTQAPAKPPASARAARQAVLSRQSVTAAQHPAKDAQPFSLNQSAPWPFQLVEPRQTGRLTPTVQRTVNLREPAPIRSGAEPAQQPAQAHGQPFERLLAHAASASSARLTPGAATDALLVRPMTLQQADMPVTTVRFPAAFAERAPMPETQARFSPARSETHPGLLTTRNEGQNRSDSERVPETDGVNPVRVGHAMRSANSVATNRRPGPAQPSLGGLALLRAPAAMLGLSPAQSGATVLSSQPAGSAELVSPAERGTDSQPVEREWPLFGLLRQLEASPQPAESSALQHLRRMWPQSQLRPTVGAAFAASAALGPGKPLSPELRGRMETHLGRPLGEVRLHASPIAQMLRAEAFTSGSHVVFAPGRLDPSTPAGLALLGHELSHIGQALAFKTESGAGSLPEDSGEQAARQQEEQIRGVIAQGWPEPTQRAYRQSPQAQMPASPAVPVRSAAAVQRAVEISEVEIVPSQPVGQTTPQDDPAAPAQTGSQAARGAPASAGAQPAANVDALARQVYSILKERLRAERTRHDLYGR